MRLLDAARSAPARYALVFAAASAVIMGSVFTLIYVKSTSMLEAHFRGAIEAQIAIFRDDLAQDGIESLVGLVSQHTERNDADRIHILLQDRHGKALAGDLPPRAATPGWQEIEAPSGLAGTSSERRELLGFGTRLEDNSYLLVTHDTADLRGAQVLLLQSFIVALGVTIVLTLVGGLAIGSKLLRRVDEVSRTARAIMEGDLSRRIPVHGRTDELGGLAESLNRMLARIEYLMENLRHVTSNIAHDLRSPLSRHRQRLYTVRQRPRSAEEYEVAIDASVEESDAILKTFDAILQIAQIEAGTPRSALSAVNLSEIGENVLDALTAVAEDAGQQFVGHIDPDISVHGNQELLTQMLVNLVENSLHHTAEGTTIQMHIGMFAGRARITVSDDGPGIPVSERARVFERFYRLDASRSTPGNGLGLSFVLAVVNLHDGTISLEDNMPGLRVVVAFP